MDNTQEEQDKKAPPQQPAGFVGTAGADDVANEKDAQRTADFYAALLHFMGGKQFPAEIDDLIKKFDFVDDTPPTSLESATCLSAVCHCGCDQKLDITKNSVLTDTKPLTMDAAIEMAILALANPSLREGGVELQGTEEEQKILAVAAHYLGLKIKNPPADFDKDPALQDSAKAAWSKLHTDNHSHDEHKEPENTANAAPENDAQQSEPEDDPQSDNTSSSQKNASKDDKVEQQYQAAKDAVLDEKKVSNKFIKEAAHVGYEKAKKFLQRMEDEGVIEKVGKRTYDLAKRFNKKSKISRAKTPNGPAVFNKKMGL